MKRMLLFAALSALLCFPAFFALAASSKTAPEAIFLNGVRAYDEGRFAEAAEAFASLAEGGVVNAKLYYDLGNALMKDGKLGPAILWYERASRLAPDDPELAFNLARADERLKDAREEGGGSMARIAFFLYGTLSQNALAWATLACNALFWAALAAWRFRERKPLAKRFERALKGLALAALAGVCLFGPSAGYAWYAAASDSTGVILQDEVAVRSGKSADAAALFTLHAGTRVVADVSEDGWTRIRFGRDKLGWAPANAVGLVGEIAPQGDKGS